MTQQEKAIVSKALNILQVRCEQKGINVPTTDTMLKWVEYRWDMDKYNH